MTPQEAILNYYKGVPKKEAPHTWDLTKTLAGGVAQVSTINTFVAANATAYIVTIDGVDYTYTSDAMQ